MEELGLTYKLERYERDAFFRAPASLKAVHPLGKAPIIQDGDLTIAESALILTYINDRYGMGRLAPEQDTKAAWLHEEWLQYVESSAAFPVMLTLVGGMIGGLPMNLEGFALNEAKAALDYIATTVQHCDYLLGHALTIADIQLSYLLMVADHLGLLVDQPVVSSYLERLTSRPAFAKALTVSGPVTPPPM